MSSSKLFKFVKDPKRSNIRTRSRQNKTVVSKKPVVVENQIKKVLEQCQELPRIRQNLLLASVIGYPGVAEFMAFDSEKRKFIIDKCLAADDVPSCFSRHIKFQKPKVACVQETEHSDIENDSEEEECCDHPDLEQPIDFITGDDADDDYVPKLRVKRKRDEKVSFEQLVAEIKSRTSCQRKTILIGTVIVSPPKRVRFENSLPYSQNRLNYLHEMSCSEGSVRAILEELGCGAVPLASNVKDALQKLSQQTGNSFETLVEDFRYLFVRC